MFGTAFMIALAFMLAAAPAPASAQTGREAINDSAAPSTVVKPVIARIAIFGNKVTDPEIILRELTLRIGDRIDDEEIEFNQARIYSLGLFNRVSIQYPPMDSTVLIIEVNERMFFYPVPVIGVVDKDITKWYYGAGVLHSNFRGRNERLFGGFALGYNPWIELRYTNPWIFGAAQMNSDTQIKYENLRNRSIVSRAGGPRYDEDHYSFAQTMGRRFGLYNSTYITLGWHYVEPREHGPDRTISEGGIDRYFSITAGYKLDTRNLLEYPTVGTFVHANVMHNGLGLSDVDFVSVSLDMRRYVQVLGSMSVCVRGFSRVCFGPAIPNYEHGFFGYDERLRGYFEKVMEGGSIAGASAELRFPIIKPFYLDVKQVPVPEFALWRLGLYAAVFFDAGKTWNHDEYPFRTRIPFGYGGGLHLLLPYGFVGRLEYALNDKSDGEIIFGVGASF
jgi:outer membrane protein assembly factor BamA